MSDPVVRPSSPSQHDPFLESPRNGSHGEPTFSKPKPKRATFSFSSSATSSRTHDAASAAPAYPPNSHHRAMSSSSATTITSTNPMGGHMTLNPLHPAVQPNSAYLPDGDQHQGHHAKSVVSPSMGYNAGGNTPSSLSRSSTSSGPTRKPSVLLFKTPQAPVTSGISANRRDSHLSVPTPTHAAAANLARTSSANAHSPYSGHSGGGGSTPIIYPAHPADYAHAHRSGSVYAQTHHHRTQTSPTIINGILSPRVVPPSSHLPPTAFQHKQHLPDERSRGQSRLEQVPHGLFVHAEEETLSQRSPIARDVAAYGHLAADRVASSSDPLIGADGQAMSPAAAAVAGSHAPRVTSPSASNGVSANAIYEGHGHRPMGISSALKLALNNHNNAQRLSAAHQRYATVSAGQVSDYKTYRSKSIETSTMLSSHLARPGGAKKGLKERRRHTNPPTSYKSPSFAAGLNVPHDNAKSITTTPIQRVDTPRNNLQQRRVTTTAAFSPSASGGAPAAAAAAMRKAVTSPKIAATSPTIQVAHVHAHAHPPIKATAIKKSSSSSSSSSSSHRRAVSVGDRRVAAAGAAPRDQTQSIFLMEQLTEEPAVIDQKQRVREVLASVRAMARDSLCSKVPLPAKVAAEIELEMFMNVTFGEAYDRKLMQLINVLRSEETLRSQVVSRATSAQSLVATDFGGFTFDEDDSDDEDDDEEDDGGNSSNATATTVEGEDDGSVTSSAASTPKANSMSRKRGFSTPRARKKKKSKTAYCKQCGEPFAAGATDDEDGSSSKSPRDGEGRRRQQFCQMCGETTRKPRLSQRQRLLNESMAILKGTDGPKDADVSSEDETGSASAASEDDRGGRSGEEEYTHRRRMTMPAQLPTSDFEDSLSYNSESFFGSGGTPSENGYTALDSKKAAKKAQVAADGGASKSSSSATSKLRRISLKPFLKRHRSNIDAYALSTAQEEREEAQSVRKAEHQDGNGTGTTAYNDSIKYGHGVSNIKRRSIRAASKITQVFSRSQSPGVAAPSSTTPAAADGAPVTRKSTLMRAASESNAFDHHPPQPFQVSEDVKVRSDAISCDDHAAQQSNEAEVESDLSSSSKGPPSSAPGKSTGDESLKPPKKKKSKSKKKKKSSGKKKKKRRKKRSMVVTDISELEAGFLQMTSAPPRITESFQVILGQHRQPMRLTILGSNLSPAPPQVQQPMPTAAGDDLSSPTSTTSSRRVASPSSAASIHYYADKDQHPSSPLSVISVSSETSLHGAQSPSTIPQIHGTAPHDTLTQLPDSANSSQSSSLLPSAVQLPFDSDSSRQAQKPLKKRHSTATSSLTSQRPPSRGGPGDKSKRSQSVAFANSHMYKTKSSKLAPPPAPAPNSSSASASSSSASERSSSASSLSSAPPAANGNKQQPAADAAEHAVFSPLASPHEVVASAHVTVRLFSSFFHPLGVTEGRVVRQSKGCIVVEVPPEAFPSDTMDVVASDERPPCSGCVSCVGVPLYACVICQGQMSDAIQVGILSLSKDGKEPVQLDDYGNPEEDDELGVGGGFSDDASDSEDDNDDESAWNFDEEDLRRVYSSLSRDGAAPSADDLRTSKQKESDAVTTPGASGAPATSTSASADSTDHGTLPMAEAVRSEGDVRVSNVVLESEPNRSSFEVLIQSMTTNSKQPLVIRNRTKDRQLFAECFVGSEFVDWLSETRQIPRGEAVKVGAEMFQRLYIRHVTDSAPFLDGDDYYRFLAPHCPMNHPMDRVSRSPPDFDTRPRLPDAHCYSCDTKNLFNSGSVPPPIPSTNSSKNAGGKGRKSSSAGGRRTTVADASVSEERPSATYVYHCWKCSLSLCPGCSLKDNIDGVWDSSTRGHISSLNGRVYEDSLVRRKEICKLHYSPDGSTIRFGKRWMIDANRSSLWKVVWKHATGKENVWTRLCATSPEIARSTEEALSREAKAGASQDTASTSSSSSSAKRGGRPRNMSHSRSSQAMERRSSTHSIHSTKSAREGADVTPPVLKYQQTTLSKIESFARFSGDPSISQEALTRGHLQLSEEVLEAEKFLESLQDETYDVTKINQRGRRQQRQLKLTRHGIENIRKNGFVSSLHVYEDVNQVILNKIDELVILFENYHSLKYHSKVAAQIVQSIEKRIAVRTTTQKRKFACDLSLEFQKKWERQERERRNMARKQTQSFHERSVSMSEGATSEPPLEAPPPPPEDAVTDTSAPDADADADASPAAPTERMSSDQMKEHVRQHGKRKAYKDLVHSKLTALTGETIESRISFSIDRELLNPQSDEGRARNRFLRKFSQFEKKSNEEAVQAVRQFMNVLKNFIFERHGEELMELIRSSSSRVDESEIDTETLSYIENSVERAIVGPLKDRLTVCIEKQCLKDQRQLLSRIDSLRGRKQEFFGIPEDYVSPSRWSSAVYELTFLERMSLPSQKIKTLVLAAKAIYNTYTYERQKYSKKKSYLAGDEFLPIAIFVVVEAGGAFSIAVKNFLMELCDPSALAGEQGYYLTAFEAALEYIKGADVDAMQKQFEQNYGANESSKAAQYHTRAANTVMLASPKDVEVAGRWSKPSASRAGAGTATGTTNGNGTPVASASASGGTTAANEKPSATSKKEKKGAAGGTKKKAKSSKSKKKSSTKSGGGSKVASTVERAQHESEAARSEA